MSDQTSPLRLSAESEAVRALRVLATARHEGKASLSERDVYRGVRAADAPVRKFTALRILSQRGLAQSLNKPGRARYRITQAGVDALALLDREGGRGANDA